MSNLETVGSKGELSEKSYHWNLGYFVFSIVVAGALLYSYVGGIKLGLLQQSLGILFFVALMGAYNIFRMIDIGTKHREGFQELDTVGVEEPIIPGLTANRTFIISVFLAAFILFRILGVGAWVAAPEITIFQSASANAAVSGFAGIAEQQGFFYFLFPVTLAIFSVRLGINPIIALIISMFIVASIFTGYHLWRYKYVEGALFSVFTFGIINILGVYFLRSVFFGDILHFFNNYFVSAGFTSTVAVAFKLI